MLSKHWNLKVREGMPLGTTGSLGCSLRLPVTETWVLKTGNKGVPNTGLHSSHLN